MSDIILHHYAGSLFSEKIRLLLGYLKLPWKSVVTAPIMPRPLLMPLTGGYRRTPNMQQGADVWCDYEDHCGTTGRNRRRHDAAHRLRFASRGGVGRQPPVRSRRRGDVSAARRRRGDEHAVVDADRSVHEGPRGADERRADRHVAAGRRGSASRASIWANSTARSRRRSCSGRSRRLRISPCITAFGWSPTIRSWRSCSSPIRTSRRGARGWRRSGTARSPRSAAKRRSPSAPRSTPMPIPKTTAAVAGRICARSTGVGGADRLRHGVPGQRRTGDLFRTRIRGAPARSDGR